MSKKDDTSSNEELVQNFLKKNKNFFIKNPELLKELQFPLKDEGSEKVIDLQVYRYKKINQENIDLQNQMTQILLAGKSHVQTQKRILDITLLCPGRTPKSPSFPGTIIIPTSSLKMRFSGETKSKEIVAITPLQPLIFLPFLLLHQCHQPYRMLPLACDHTHLLLNHQSFLLYLQGLHIFLENQ